MLRFFEESSLASLLPHLCVEENRRQPLAVGSPRNKVAEQPLGTHWRLWQVLNLKSKAKAKAKAKPEAKAMGEDNNNRITILKY